MEWNPNLGFTLNPMFLGGHHTRRYHTSDAQFNILFFQLVSLDLLMNRE